jgi:magnesium chelatase family protein
LETGHITVTRADSHVTYPARVQLIAAMNPCRCGYLDDPSQACSRAPKCAQDYQVKIFSPLFDRIDLHVDVPAVNPADLGAPAQSESSADILKRATAVREIQRNRYDLPIRTNAEADGKLLEKIATPDESGKKLIMDTA